jgi:hypothetical protein
MTKKAQVLNRLREAAGEWVDGTELANEEVGGSEGLKRLRELRLEGWPIEERPRPSPRRAIWQYRLARGPELTQPVEPVPQGPTSPLAAGAPTRPAAPSSEDPRYPCPAIGCPRNLMGIRALIGGYVEGKCYQHGKRVVRA